MKKIFFAMAAVVLLAACDDAKEAGDETAREITGANTIEQGRKAQQRIKEIDQQQQQRFEQLDQQ